MGFPSLARRRKDPDHISGTAYGFDNYSVEYHHPQVQ